MPSFLSDDTGPMFSTTRPLYDVPSHVRQSHEKTNGNVRMSSHTSMKGLAGEFSDGYIDTQVGGKSQMNGDMLRENGLNSTPNGRSSGGSWDYRTSTNGSTLSSNGTINGTSNGVTENRRRSPEPQNGFSRTSYGDRNSVASTNGNVPNTVDSNPSTNGDNEPQKKLSIPPPISTNPQSTGPLTYSTSLLPATPTPIESPKTTTTSPAPHRFSSPPSYPSPHAPSPSTSSPAHPGSTQLKHRHTLQVPKAAPGRSSRDGDDAVYTTGRFSPTSVVSGVRRTSLSLGRRNTQSIHSNMPHEELTLDEDALQWAEAVRQKRASKRRRKEDEDDDRVVVGTKVDQNHVNWVTAYNMLTGIRFTVSRTNAKLDRPLTDADFEARHKFSFDM
jgi:1-phosphatidylinositol-4-phosphate 5-kinase